MTSDTGLVLRQQSALRELREQIVDLTAERDAWRERYHEALTGTPSDVLALVRNPWRLTPKELLVLLALLRRPGGAPKHHVYNALYGLDPGDTPELKIIDVFVCKIRKKLGAGKIETLWGMGYRVAEDQRQQIVDALGFDPAGNKALGKASRGVHGDPRH